MRLPPHLFEAPLFQFLSVGDLRAAAPAAAIAQIDEAQRLVDLGLPPVVSVELLSIMFGLNSGVVWSFCHKPERYYRTFAIKKGAGERHITAPRIGLKIIQKWMGYHLSKVPLADHVYGFVPGRSHIDAALRHSGAHWAVSVDLLNFFPSTPREKIIESLVALSYTANSAEIIANLNTLGGFLVQGSPASPALSNICFSAFDTGLQQIAMNYGCNVTRYADDISFSGKGEMPPALLQDIQLVLAVSPWQINPQKTEIQPLRGRIKIHGLLVKSESVRLTKGYRNKVRAYSHVLRNKSLSEADFRRLAGHIHYTNQVNTRMGLGPVLGNENMKLSKHRIVETGIFTRIRRFFSRFVRSD
jgi:RNA-directed DNA polymerase